MDRKFDRLNTTDVQEPTLLLLVDVVFQNSMRAAAMLLHDSDYQRTLSSKKNAMHERERFARWGAGRRNTCGRGWASVRLANQSIALSKIGCARRDGGVE